jgi:hypothetical protein
VLHVFNARRDVNVALTAQDRPCGVLHRGHARAALLSYAVRGHGFWEPSCQPSQPGDVVLDARLVG